MNAQQDVIHCTKYFVFFLFFYIKQIHKKEYTPKSRLPWYINVLDILVASLMFLCLNNFHQSSKELKTEICKMKLHYPSKTMKTENTDRVINAEFCSVPSIKQITLFRTTILRHGFTDVADDFKNHVAS